METLEQRVANLKNILTELIELLESNSTNADALKETLSMFDRINDTEVLEEYVQHITQMIQKTMEELKISMDMIKRKKFQAKEEIDELQDSKESETLINTL